MTVPRSPEERTLREDIRDLRHAIDRLDEKVDRQNGILNEKVNRQYTAINDGLDRINVRLDIIDALTAHIREDHD